jgi:hypothetical protein
MDHFCSVSFCSLDSILASSTLRGSQQRYRQLSARALCDMKYATLDHTHTHTHTHTHIVYAACSRWMHSFSVTLTKHYSGDPSRTMWHVWGMGHMYTGFWWGNMRGKRSLGRPRLRWEDNIQMDLQEVRCGVWTGSSWLRIGTVGGQL